MSEHTIERWCKRTYELGFAEAYKKFSATGKTSRRRSQFDLANKGNATMLIWLGKQYLGQTDKPIPEEPDAEVNVAETLKLLFPILKEAVLAHRASVSQSENTSD